jgi:hypothetical protein
MNTVTILRNLWHRRRFVVVVALVALLVALVVGFKVPSFKSRQYQVGVATVHILVDTPSSQVVNIAPRGSDTTAARASLLASLMVEGDIENNIAQEAGLKPSQLSGATGAAISPSAGGPDSPPPSSPTAYSLNTQVLTNTTGDTLPIIEVDTQAPTAAGAERLANASISGLKAYLNSKAALEKIPDADRLDVTGMGAPEGTLQAHGPSNAMVLLVFLLLFATGCIGILVVQALVRGWRAASERDREQGEFDEGGLGVPFDVIAAEAEAPDLVRDPALEPVEDSADPGGVDRDLLWASIGCSSLGYHVPKDVLPAGGTKK